MSFKRAQLLQKLPDGSLYYALPGLEDAGLGSVARLPFTLRIIVESMAAFKVILEV